jgi:hypothetical protein
MSELTVAISVLLFVAFSEVAAAIPPEASAQVVMAHHITMIKKDDVDGIMKDYAEKAVIVGPTQTYIGAANVRHFFEALAAQHRDWKSFIVTQEVKEDGVVLQTEVKTGKVEVFVVRNGKIAFQTSPK